MSDLLAARWQMGLSLGFHILFACVGIGLPLMMVIAEGLWLRTGQPLYRVLAQRWARGAAILFAVGAVSGTVLSFELGLLWPRFMEVAGPVVGVGFGLEGFAFFLEAIFLGVYLYGWDKMGRVAHWLAGVVVAASGALSGVLVVAVNAWMNTPNTPASFRLGPDGLPTDIDPFSALLNPMTVSQALHMTLAAYIATGFAVASVHAWFLLRDRANPFHRRALAIALVVGGAAALLQPLSGDFSAKRVAATQPAKLAAMEGQFRTERGAPLRIGGWPDPSRRETPLAVEVPKLLSILAHGAPDAEVVGLDDIAADERPPVVTTHVAFQIMVGCGMAVALLAAWAGVAAWRRRAVPEGRWLLRGLVAGGPLAMLAVLAGWTVTEVGRQPWVIRGVMRTAESVTTVKGLGLSLAAYTALYVLLGAVVAVMLGIQFGTSPPAAEAAALVERSREAEEVTR